MDLVISSHPDMDHASGLLVVFEKMKVIDLVMHRPWNHAKDIKRDFINGKVTISGIKKDLEKSLAYASDIEDIAIKNGTIINEPFAGITGFGGIMHVLGPTEKYYEDLLSQFRGTPEPKYPISALGMVKKNGDSEVKIIQDNINMNYLDDEDSTTPENNSSTIVLFNIDGHKILFTGDAGKRAIENAIVYAKSQNINLKDLIILHVPHHGSKRNFGKTVMDNLHAQHAYISAPVNSNKHPAAKVTNHLFKRGIKTYATQGRHIYHFYGVPIRNGWGPITPIPFQSQIEL